MYKHYIDNIHIKVKRKDELTKEIYTDCVGGTYELDVCNRKLTCTKGAHYNKHFVIFDHNADHSVLTIVQENPYYY